MIKDFIEDKLAVNKIGIFGAFWLLVLSIALESVIGNIPLFIGARFLYNENAVMIFKAYELFIEIAVKIVVMYLLLKLYTNKNDIEDKVDETFVDETVVDEISTDIFESVDAEKTLSVEERMYEKKTIFKKSIYVHLGLMVVLFRMFFDNSLGYLVVWAFPVEQWLIDAFEQMSIVPVFGIVSIVLIAPVFEEMVFRGIMLRGLLKSVNPKVAIITSSFLFAFVHFNMAQGINAFLLGLMASYVFYKTKSLKYAIYVHFVNNGFVMSLGIILDALLEVLPQMVRYGIGMIFLAVFLCHLRFVIKKELSNKTVAEI